MFLARVCFEAVFGAHVTTLLTVHGGARFVFVFGLIILSMIAFMVMASKRRQRDAFIAGGLLLLAFAIVLISTLVRYVEPDTRLIYLENPYLQRYMYVPRLIIALLLLWQLVPRIQGALRYQNAIGRIALVAACCLYVAGIAADNLFLYRQSQTEGRRVRDFISSAYADLRRAER